MSIPRVLSIAGSDSGGGAGIQADLKSIAACGGYGMTAVTALTAQNSRGVVAVHVPPAEFLRAQLDAVAADIGIDAVKIGMLGSRDNVVVVGAWLAERRPPLVVLDPVMVATSGDHLLDPGATESLRRLGAACDLITPNLSELAMLADEPEPASWTGALEQARRLSRRLGTTIVVKGGHLGGEQSPDAIVDASADVPVTEVPGIRIESTNTHGTGCSLSSALATLIPQLGDRVAALRRAKAWLATAIRAGAALEVGGGNGPVDHFAAWRPHLHAADPVWVDAHPG